MATILIVENESHQCLLLREEFQQEGHEVVTASNGEDALSATAATMPHIAVLDICMPGMDGAELLPKLHSINNRLPVVVYTGFAAYRDDPMSWGADAYVLKSSDLTELKQTVRHILETRQGVARQRQGRPRSATDTEAPLVPQQFRNTAGLPPGRSACRLLTCRVQAVLPAPPARPHSTAPFLRAKELGTGPEVVGVRQ